MSSEARLAPSDRSSTDKRASISLATRSLGGTLDMGLVSSPVFSSANHFRGTCQGRNEMPQNRRSKVPQKRRFEKSPASVVLLHRGRRGKMTEHAGFQ